jgi:hypothetical protein
LPIPLALRYGRKQLRVLPCEIKVKDVCWDRGEEQRGRLEENTQLLGRT